MAKRKLDESTILSQENTVINNINFPNNNLEYYNPYNCDSIKIFNNRIIFHATITEWSIEKLFEFIKIIVNSSTFDRINNRIYIHIISKGGILQALYNFINIKNTQFSNIEFISVIENSCTDAGFLLAALCNYRIIKKNVICYMSKINIDSWYWGMFYQGDNSLEKFEYIISNIIFKVSKDKLLKYTNENNIWNAKKMIKIGFMDEII